MQEAPLSPSAQQRLHGLDFLRAIMMLLGVVLHSAQLYLTMPIIDYYWDPARSFSMDAILIFINTFRMPVFFLLAGFFMAMLLLRRGEQAMLENRYQRLIVPFVLFLPPLALVMTILRIIARHIMETGVFGFDPGLVYNPRRIWDNTHNLWFLYYLILYLGSVWLILKLWRRLSEQRRDALTAWAQRTPIFSASVFLPVCLGFAALGSLSFAGRLSGTLSFVPYPPVYLYFGLCFVLGWLLYQRLQDLQTLAGRWRRDMIIATLLLAVALGAFFAKGGMPSGPQESIWQLLLAHSVLSLATGFSMGYYMLAFVGLFSRHFQGYSPWIRWISDSAYWVFIFHSVPLIIIALPLHDWQVAAELKFLVVCSGTFAICLLTYQLFVRNGRIGEILNGRRYASVPWKNN